MATPMLCQRALKELRRWKNLQLLFVRHEVSSSKYTGINPPQTPGLINDPKNSTTGCHFIFLPEVPTDTRETNPLLRYEDYPRFSQMTANSVLTGCSKLTQECDAHCFHLFEDGILPESTLSISKLVREMESVLVPMTYAANVARILHLTNFPKFSQKLQDRVTSQIQRLKEERFKSPEFWGVMANVLVRADDKKEEISEMEMRLMKLYLFECELYGFRRIMEQSKKSESAYMSAVKENEKRVDFMDKVLKHRSLYELNLGPKHWEIVKELPRPIRFAIAVDKSHPDRGPWKLKLFPKVVESFVETCPNRSLRFQVWNAENTVCSNITTDMRLSNEENLENIIDVRYSQATYAGHKSYADMYLKNSMALTENTVQKMLDKFREHFLPMAFKEFEELQWFAQGFGFKGDIKQWDIPYYRRQHVQYLYRMYHVDRMGFFSLDSVQNVMFGLCEQLFGFKIKQLDVQEENIDVWNSDVMVFNVYDTDDNYMARFYVDPFARSMLKIRQDTMEMGRPRSDVLGVDPICFISLCIVKSGLPNTPAYLTYRDVLSYFYQFGRALQYLVTAVPLSELVTQQRFDRDGMHVTPYLMQLLAQRPDVIEDMSEASVTGQRLTSDEVDRLKKTTTYMKGFDMCTEMYKAAFDMEAHSSVKEKHWAAIQSKTYKKYMPLPLFKDDCSWTSDMYWVDHTVAAGYYQFMWSEMLACNVYQKMEDIGWDNKEELQAFSRRFAEVFVRELKGTSANMLYLLATNSNYSMDSMARQYPQYRDCEPLQAAE